MCQTHLHTWNTTSFPHTVLNPLYLVTAHNNNVYVNNTIQTQPQINNSHYTKTEKNLWWRATATRRSCVRENQKREPVGGCGAQRRKSVGGCGAQRRKAVGRGEGRRLREAVWGKTKEGNLWVDATLNEGNLWVAATLNGGRSLGGVEGDGDEKLCEGN